MGLGAAALWFLVAVGWVPGGCCSCGWSGGVQPICFSCRRSVSIVVWDATALVMVSMATFIFIASSKKILVRNAHLGVGFGCCGVAGRHPPLVPLPDHALDMHVPEVVIQALEPLDGVPAQCWVKHGAIVMQFAPLCAFNSMCQESLAWRWVPISATIS